MVIGQGQRLFADAVLLLAHQDGGGSGVVDGTKVHGAVGEVGRQDLHAGGLEFGHRAADVRVQLHVHPVLAAAGGALALVDPALGPDRVHPVDADGIGGAHDGGQVVRFMNLFHADGQVELALGQHVGNAFEAFRSHVGFYVVRPVHATRLVACGMGPWVSLEKQQAACAACVQFFCRLTLSTLGMTRILRMMLARWIRLLVVMSRVTT